MKASDKVRIKLHELLQEQRRLESEIEAAMAQVEPVVSPKRLRIQVIAAQVQALAPWPEDLPEEERESACFSWPGLGVLRRIWMKPKRQVNVARLLEHVDKDVIDECTDETPGSTRVQFYPERRKA